MSRLFGLFCEGPVKLSSTLMTEVPQLSDTGISDDTPVLPDGWGIGFYREQGSFLFKKASRSSGKQRITNLTEVVSSQIFISHARIATIGDRKEANTHPFRWGKWLFAHLGTINQFRRIRSKILRRLPPAYKKLIRGNTDSEHLFYFYLSLLRGEGWIKRGNIPLESAVNGLRQFGSYLDGFHREAEVSDRPVLNFLLSNSSYLIATRSGAPLYYYMSKNNDTGETSFFSPTTMLNFRIINSDQSNKYIVIASERLSNSHHWHEVPEQHIITINTAEEVHITPWQ